MEFATTSLPDRTLLRPALAAAAAGMGPPVRLMLITGTSLAGKTRSAVEAMRAELPTWRLLIPHGAHSLAKLLDHGFHLRHTVMWLNEAQELLGQNSDVEQVERLLDLDTGPTVLLATLRADREDALRGTAGAGGCSSAPRTASRLTAAPRAVSSSASSPEPAHSTTLGSPTPSSRSTPGTGSPNGWPLARGWP